MTPIDRDRLAVRWRAVWGAMARAGLDGLVVAGRGMIGQYGDVHWLSGFPLFNSVGHGYAFLTKGVCVRLVVGRRDQELAEELGVADLVERSVLADAPAVGDTGLVGQLAALIEQHGLARQRIGVVGTGLVMPAGDWLALRAALPEVTLVDAGDLLARLKRRKTAADLADCREGYRLADDGFDTFLEHVRPGRSEAEVAAEVERTVRAQGALATLVQVLDGRMWTRPPGPRILGQDELIACYVEVVAPNGCWSEKGAMFALGTVSDRALEVAEAGERLHDAARARLVPGTPASEIAALVQTRAAGSGCRPGIWAGHGVGVDHDQPLLNGEDDTPMEAGMVVALHPHICDARHGAISIDQYAITDEGPVRFSRHDRGLRHVG